MALYFKIRIIYFYEKTLKLFFLVTMKPRLNEEYVFSGLNRKPR